jgi:hypothetical protein
MSGTTPRSAKFRNHVRAVSDQPDRNIFFFTNRVLQNAQGFVESGDHEVAIAGLQALLDALRIDVNAQKSRAGHGCGEGLSSTHAAHAAADDQLAGEVAAKMLFSSRGKCLERSLHDSLGADVNPGAGGHLAVHHQAGAFEFVELLPVRPVAYQI